MAAALAKRLRATTEHDDAERFELANYTEAQAEDLIAQAFAAPFESATEHVRISFIIGGGKLVRHKFDEALGKYLTAALRKLGYEEDKGASLGSEKAYKMQHDTGQNLIYLHVFPETTFAAARRAGGGGAGGGGAGGGGGGGEGEDEVVFDMASPPVRCIACEVFDFKKLVESRVAPWSHRRRLVQLLQDAVRQIEAAEAKMVAREALTPVEQAKYDLTSRQGLEEKLAFLQASMKEQVSAGALSAAERETVLREMDERLKAMKEEQDKAAADGHEKPAMKLAEQRAALTARRDALKTTFAATQPASWPVKAIADIRQCRSQLIRLDKIEAAGAAGAGGKALTAAEALARRTELDTRGPIEERLAELAAEARMWFETASEFEARIQDGIAALGGSLRAMKGAGKR